MDQAQYDRLIILEDYLKRYIKKELNDFERDPPKNAFEQETLKLFKSINELFIFTDIYNIECNGEIMHLRNRVKYLEDKNKALQHICKQNGLNTNFTAYIKDTDY